MSFRGLTRRSFLTHGVAGVAAVAQPGAIASLTQAASQSPLAKYALKKVAAHFVPFFGWGAYFGNNEFSIDPEILTRIDDLLLLDDIIDLPLILNPDFKVPEFIEEGIPFKMGHLLSEENIAIRQLFSQSEGITEEWTLDEAESSLRCFKEDILGFLEKNPDFGSLEDLVEMPVRQFYQDVYQPLFKKSLDGIMDGMDAIKPEDYDLYGSYLSEIPNEDFVRLKKEYPHCAEKIQDVVDTYRLKQQIKNHTAYYHYQPIGFIRIEKKPFGQYRFTSPQVL